ncbi:hypothetical protein LTR08_008597 [Meristemomyces frigidus]|nr:hypothetical protein LTR08_008597 [Meristemomyces frigidus]
MSPFESPELYGTRSKKKEEIVEQAGVSPEVYGTRSKKKEENVEHVHKQRKDHGNPALRRKREAGAELRNLGPVLVGRTPFEDQKTDGTRNGVHWQFKRQPEKNIEHERETDDEDERVWHRATSSLRYMRPPRRVLESSSEEELERVSCPTSRNTIPVHGSRPETKRRDSGSGCRRRVDGV